MPQYYTLPTAIGEAKIANAIALGGTITIADIAIGDGGGTTPVPDSDVTALVNEVRRAPINTSVVDPDNPSWIVVEQVLPPDIGGWTIREIGLYDADGDLIAYGNYPETYKPVLSEGSGRTQTIRFVMQVSDTAAVTLKVDPSVVLATREYVDDEIAEHAASRDHPDATTAEKGFMQYGTSAEARAGARIDRAAHLAGVHAAFKQFGLGLTGTPPVTDLNTVYLSGFYSATGTAQPKPAGVTATQRHGLLVVGETDPETGTTRRTIQVLFSSIDSSAFIRSMNASGIWSEWQMLFHAGNFNPATKADVSSLNNHTNSLAAHKWSAITEKPTTATRWPAWGEVTGKPSADQDTAGVVELADEVEARAFSDALRALTPATLDASLKGANQSLTSNGYQRLPGGLIIQWGVGTHGASSGSGAINLPIAFPNGMLDARLTETASVEVQDEYTLSWRRDLSTNSAIGYQIISSGTAVIGDFSFMAIGH